ncbi:MAG: protein kinase [Pyrinomonadaceae bacterium]|nr:protein kinase [Pyrinomonadaceae bacterium]
MVGESINQYQILEKLGAGGQGTVYKALDTKLDRKIVIKVLPPELTAKTANFKRFEREAKLCSQLDHPNICTIYDYHEDDGTFYIAMQYVKGKNVRQLVDGRPLDLKSALKIAIQVCDALALAHSKNIIHRDIKAGNVMVTDEGQVKILDFGLAKLMMDEPTKKEKGVDLTDLTEIGIPYGTATYAAPEQAKGDLTDHRADIFSTGVLIYEMLTGIWAFQGKTVIDVRHQVLHGTPTPLAEMRPEALPPKLQKVIDKALAKEPGDRYQNVADMRDELRGVLEEISGVAMTQNDAFTPGHLETKSPVKRAWNWLTGKSDTQSAMSNAPSYSNTQITPTYSPDTTLTTTGREKTSIAILPFTNLSKDPSTDFYEFALADAVITELAKLKSLIVRPSSVIAKYQGKEFEAREVGRELQVHAVLTAGFISSGDKMRVTTQLVDIVSGGILWSDRIDAESGDILALQDNIGQHILEGLRVELSDEEQEVLGHRPTENVEAYEVYLRGRDSFGRFIFQTVSAEDCDDAIKSFKTAIGLDPEFGLAYSGLGGCYANRVFKGMGDAEDHTRAEQAFRKAAELDPTISEARVLMVMIYMARDEKAKAREEIKRLQKRFPNEAPIYFVKGVLHRLDGEYDESLKSFRKLAKLDPAAKVISSYNRARIYTYRKEYDKALKLLDRGAKEEPNHPLVKVFRSNALFHKGDTDQAIEIISDVLENNPQMDGIRSMYAMFLAHKGNVEDAKAQLTKDALKISKADHDMAYWTAATYSLLGEKDEAFDWLNRAIKLGNENRPLYEGDKCLDSLRDDERYKALLNKLEMKKSA